MPHPRLLIAFVVGCVSGPAAPATILPAVRAPVSRIVEVQVSGEGRPTPSEPERTRMRDVGQTVAAWIGRLQYRNAALSSYGAVRVHHTPALVSLQGEPFFRVGPYDANLGLIGLLRSNDPDRFAVVERWIGWYTRHMIAGTARHGLVVEHWYSADGGRATTCPARLAGSADSRWCDDVDAEDSAAATFLQMAWTYADTGGRLPFLRHPEVRRALHDSAGVILRLQDSDGLTWAKSSHRAKYLMDNAEVFQGLSSMSHLQAAVYGDSAAATQYARAADRVKTGILRRFRDPRTGLFRVSRQRDGSSPRLHLDRWYPDAAAQLWPILFGVIAATDDGGRAYHSVQDRWNRRDPAEDSTTRFLEPDSRSPWISVGYAAWLAGDPEAATRQTEFVIDAHRLMQRGGQAFAWPFSIADAGWLLQVIVALSSESGIRH